MIIECRGCHAKNRVPPARLGDDARCGRCKATLVLDAPVTPATAADFDALIGGSPLPVVVDFWAAWCGPCRVVAPEVDKLARMHAGKVVVAKLDTEALPDVAARYGISGIPAFIAFRGGREAGRAVGAMPAAQLARSLGL